VKRPFEHLPDPRRPPRRPGLLAGLRQFGEELQRGRAWLVAHEDEIREWARDVRDRGGPGDPWRWLLDRVDAFTAIAIRGALEAEKRLLERQLRHGVLLTELLGEAVKTEEFQASLRDSLSVAPLTSERRAQLDQGVSYVASGDDALAVPLLLNPLEGLFWTEAEERGRIARNDRGKWLRTDSAARVGGLEAVLDALAADVDDDLRDFIRAVVYGGPGDRFRHGTATNGWRLRAALLCFAVTGWLELRTDLDARQVVRSAFRDRRDTG
jgi:hypothetical protein